MYDDAVQAIHNHLIRKSITGHLTCTSELIPERYPSGEMYVRSPLLIRGLVSKPLVGSSWRQVPTQDHLACFFGGSLMLEATTSGALVYPVSIPPRPKELTATGLHD
jgi:endoplasmic reticulum Man9GlcNAc2 1,2-alpha-mannosidase